MGRFKRGPEIQRPDIDGPWTTSYLRVSTEGQCTKKNKDQIAAFANRKDFGKVEFVEEKLSGRVPWKERKIGLLIEQLKAGDRLIVPEMSRLGRSLLQIMEMLAVLRKKDVAVYDVKNGWELNDSLQSQVMAFCFSIAAQLEHQLLIQRTAEGRAAAMAKGVKFGRPKGPGKCKLDAYKDEVIALIKNHSKQTFIARKYGVTPATVSNWRHRNNISLDEEI